MLNPAIRKEESSETSSVLPSVPVAFVKDNIASFVQDHLPNHKGNVEDFVSLEENSKIIQEFLQLEEEKTLFFMIKEGKEAISTDLNFIGKKPEFMVWFRKEKVPVSTENVSNSLSYGVISDDIFNDLITFMRDDLLTYIKGNENSWGGRKEFILSSDKILNDSTEVRNKLLGTTELYVPQEKLDEGLDPKEVRERLEPCLIRWNRQIRDLIHEKDVKTENKTILEEIEYWKNRTTGFLKLSKQLESKRMGEIVELLRTSGYIGEFLELSQTIQNERDDSIDNLKFLSTLRKQFLELNEVKEVQDIKRVIPEILKKITLIWALSKNFNTKEKITILLKKVSNEIIHIASKNISKEEIFTGNCESGIVNLEKGIRVCRLWKILCKKTLASLGLAIMKKYKKKFGYDTKEVFLEIKTFINRCEDLHEVYVSRQQFSSELPVFGGSQGYEITKSLKEIQIKFHILLQNLQNIDYHLLDVKSSKWHDDVQKFKAGVRDLEMMVNNILNNAFQSINSIKEGVELIESFRHMSKRESFLRTIESKQRDILNLFQIEVNKARSLFELFSKEPYIQIYHPKTSGTAFCVDSLMKRNIVQKKMIDMANFPENEMKKDIFKKFETLQESIKKYKEKLFDTWKKTLDSVDWKRMFDIPILKMNSNGFLEVSVNYILIKTHHELKFWEKLGFNPPQNIMEFVNEIKLGDEYIRRVERVKEICRSYNNILVSLNKDLKTKENQQTRLFKEKLKLIDKKIQVGLNKLHWKNVAMLDFFIKDSRKSCKELQKKITFFLSKWKKILDLCDNISNTLLVSIDPKKTYTEQTFLEEQRHHRNVTKRKLVLYSEEICKIILQLFDLFENDSESVLEAWWEFVGRFDDEIEKALKQTLSASFEKLSVHINGTYNEIEKATPLFSVEVKLLEENEKKPVLVPSLEELENLVQKSQFEMITCLKVVACLTPKIKFLIEYENMEEKTDMAKEMRKRKIPNYFDIIKKSESEFREKMMSSLSGVNKIKTEVEKYLHINWTKQFRDLWNTDHESTTRRLMKNGLPSTRFDQDYSKYLMKSRLVKQKDVTANIGYVQLNSTSLKQTITDKAYSLMELVLNVLHQQARKGLNDLYKMFEENTKKLKEVPTNRQMLKKKLQLLEQCEQEILVVDEGLEGKSALQKRFEPIISHYKVLKKFEKKFAPKELDQLKNLKEKAIDLEKVVRVSKVEFETHKQNFKERLLKQIVIHEKEMKKLAEELKNRGPYKNNIKINDANNSIEEFGKLLLKKQKQNKDLKDGCKLFQLNMKSYKEFKDIETNINNLNSIWALKKEWKEQWDSWRETKFSDIDASKMENGVASFMKKLNKLGRDIDDWDVFSKLKTELSLFKKTLPLIMDLKNNAIRKRHWDDLYSIIPEKFNHKNDEFTLQKILNLGFHRFAEEIAGISNGATQELSIENDLERIKENWRNLNLTILPYRETHWKIVQTEEIFETLNDDSVTLGSMKLNPFSGAFLTEMNFWEKSLTCILDALEIMVKVQTIWMYLLNIFEVSDIKKQLPIEDATFRSENEKWRKIIVEMKDTKNVLHSMTKKGLNKDLSDMNTEFEKIQRQLYSYLESKRVEFPRFYFLSNPDLLEILGNSENPHSVQRFLQNCFEGLYNLKIEKMEIKRKKTFVAKGMYSKEREFIPFTSVIPLVGAAEKWLKNVESAMRTTIRKKLRNVFLELLKIKKDRSKWLDNPGQFLITSSQLYWTQSVEEALNGTTKNNSKKDARKGQLRVLLKKVWPYILKKYCLRIRQKLTPLQRKKIIALLTIEVFHKDVIDSLVRNNITSVDSFDWNRQLRFYWNEDELVEVKQTQACIAYDYEYLGPSGRLVVTPLTERCYMTLTTAVHLSRGGNPKGPAGTGKTETVKDLGKAIAKFVLVFNCSDGLDYQSLGKMFSGLVQTGAWSCFDEFNRVEIEVLSVVAQQMRRIINAISQKLESFILEESEVKLNPTCGIFVTMNPGYAGRSELPENLKALLRPIAMMVPNASLICEIQLYSQGFDNNRELARKVSILYDLMKQQLSKQCHYDFGLRNIIAVLKVAGKIKRNLLEKGKKGVEEEQVLVRACRKVNLPKFTSNDIQLFDSLIDDLFPGVDISKDEDKSLKEAVDKCLKKDDLIIQDYICEKIFQLYNTKHTRHGIMLVGMTMSGKTTSWNVLKDAMNSLKEKKVPGFPGVIHYVINPKTMNNDELFGYYDMTREWKDGLIAVTLKKACIDTSPDEKWIIFDGPVDTIWIESMNSVLDDNKVLTLISSERITLSDKVSMIFEVEDLIAASPATVSRCGMVYYDQSRLGWRVIYDSWANKFYKKQMELRSQEHGTLESMLLDSFPQQIERLLETKKKSCVELVKTVDANVINSFINLFESLVNNELNYKSEHYLDNILNFFVFALIWSIGGTVDQKGRMGLDMIFREFSPIFPNKDTVYEYYYEPVSNVWREWEEKVPSSWVPPSNVEFSKILVPTVDTTRNSFIIKKMIENSKNMLLVGDAGTGKTAIIEYVLNELNNRKFSSTTINLSAQTSANKIQEIIESKLEKKSFDTFAPVGGKKLVVFMDDFNMPQKDEYGSQPPLELIRHFIDYGFVYDRSSNMRKVVKFVQMISAMGPPGGGRTHISQRIQSRFSILNCIFPSNAQLFKIFNTLLTHRTKKLEDLKDIIPKMTKATIDMYNLISKTMLPKPSKSHYVFNLRDLSKVFQGIFQADHESMDNISQTVKLWVHENFRVFHDRLVEEKDRIWFKEQINNSLTSVFETNWKTLYKNNSKPTPFGTIMKKESYSEMSNYEKLKEQLYFEMQDYNEQVGVNPMNLILFEDAIDMLCRITRIFSQPRGNTLLIGTGGSGRSSLTRLGAYLCGYQIYEIEITNYYNKKVFHENLQELFMMCGSEQKKLVFMFSDTQLVEENFLEDINTLLNSGDVPNLFDKEGLQVVYDQCKEDAKKAGKGENMEQVFDFFLSRVKKNLRIAILMSPVGEAFRRRLRMFPALVNCTTINYFIKWPTSALIECCKFFLKDLDLSFMKPPKKKGEEEKERTPEAIEEEEKLYREELLEKLYQLFVFVHESVKDGSEKMLRTIKRYNYVTPTNLLEVVKTYVKLTKQKKEKISNLSGKLEKGISILEDASKEVASMSIRLEKQRKKVSAANEECENLMGDIMKEKQEANAKRADVEKERELIEKKKLECEQVKKEAQTELDEAIPALERAEESLKGLDPKDISELKSYQKPKKNVEMVLIGVMVVLKRNPTYKEAQAAMSNSRKFIEGLINFEKNKMSNRLLSKIKKVIDQPNFDPLIVKKSSEACEKLCDWVVAIHIYGETYRDIKPKMERLKKAENDLTEMTNKLDGAVQSLKELDDKIAELEVHLKEKKEEQENLIKVKEDTEKRLTLASQLVTGLEGEGKRWRVSIQEYAEQMKNIVGDVFIGSAFLSYAGAFDTEFRKEIMDQWMQKVRELKIPISNEFSVTNFLAEPTEIQSFVLQELPNDQFSIQNACLTTKGSRWPLLIDPQSQGNKWIKNLEKKRHLQITDPNKEDLLRTLTNCVKNGIPLLIQDMTEEIDSSLDPVISKKIIKKGNQQFIKLGDKQVNFHPSFMLYMTTKLHNPHYDPVVSTKALIINFSVTKSALEDQLLSVLVKKERKELEDQKNEIVKSVAAGKKKLLELEDEILQMLTNSEDLLKDASVVDALKLSKQTHGEVVSQLNKSVETVKKIDKIRNEYRPAARRASVLYFVMGDLVKVDPMYQFSMEKYVELFENSIDNSDKTRDAIAKRVEMLNEHHTYEVYKSTCQGLFEKDKLLFSFHLCCQILLNVGEIDLEEYNFFLRGGVVVDKDSQMINPCPKWLPEKAWDNFFCLDSLTNFHELASSLEENSLEWHDWFKSPEPENFPLPSEWQTKCSGLWERMLLIRCCREDRLIKLIKEFITLKMKSDIFVRPPATDVTQVFHGSSPLTPLLFILSSGVDPVQKIEKLAKSENKKLVSLSLGQNQEGKATQFLRRAVSLGEWVFLANCHLMMSWMPQLEKIIEDLADDNPSDDFRLWLSSKPHPKFSISILQRSRKMTLEPSTGIQNNMVRLVGEISSEQYKTFLPPFKKCLLSLLFYHSVLLERKKFGNLGWNKLYDFNDSDFFISLDILRVYFEKFVSNGELDKSFKSSSLNWSALRFLIGEISYGGRVTDSFDQKLLNLYTMRSFNENVLSQQLYKLAADDEKFYLPKDSQIANYDGLWKFVREGLPKEDEPKTFGQHFNAIVSSRIANASKMLNDLSNLNPEKLGGEIEKKGKEGEKGNTQTPEMVVKSRIEGLLGENKNSLPEEIGLSLVLVAQNTALNTVLIQESTRYNELLRLIRKSLNDLILAINGDIVMNSSLENIFKDLNHGKVPKKWSTFYRSMKNLSGWIRDLKMRVEQMKKWAEEGSPPKIFWLGGFIFPSGFLTALKQTFARKNNISLDQLQFEYIIIGNDGVNSHPTKGAYIRGMLLEGAGWDEEKNELTEPKPMELLLKMPIIWFKPVISKKKKGSALVNDKYQCPVYYFPKRGAESFVCKVDLKCGEKGKERWIKRGTAILLSDTS